MLVSALRNYCAALLLLSTGVAGAQVTPPPQPFAGPGGSDYPHASVQVTLYGTGDDRYWIYEPADPSPSSAPVVAYLHGYSAFRPEIYDGLLRHLARKGHTVVFPRHGGLINVFEYEEKAVAAIRDAFERLSGPQHVDPEIERFAVLGHSLGGVLSLRIAHASNAHGLPAPLAVVLHDAAGFRTPAYPFMRIDDLSGIDPEALLILVCAEESVRDRNATGIWSRAWRNTPQIPRERRNLIVVRTDVYGDPDLVSDHVGVETEDVLDAIDWYGYWKPTEAALAFAFRGEYGEFVLGDEDELRDMGRWSDGTPVTGAVPISDR